MYNFYTINHNIIFEIINLTQCFKFKNQKLIMMKYDYDYFDKYFIIREYASLFYNNKS